MGNNISNTPGSGNNSVGYTDTSNVENPQNQQNVQQANETEPVQPQETDPTEPQNTSPDYNDSKSRAEENSPHYTESTTNYEENLDDQITEEMIDDLAEDIDQDNPKQVKLYEQLKEKFKAAREAEQQRNNMQQLQNPADEAVIATEEIAETHEELVEEEKQEATEKGKKEVREFQQHITKLTTTSTTQYKQALAKAEKLREMVKEEKTETVLKKIGNHIEKKITARKIVNSKDQFQKNTKDILQDLKSLWSKNKGGLSPTNKAVLAANTKADKLTREEKEALKQQAHEEGADGIEGENSKLSTKERKEIAKDLVKKEVSVKDAKTQEAIKKYKEAKAKEEGKELAKEADETKESNDHPGLKKVSKEAIANAAQELKNKGVITAEQVATIMQAIDSGAELCASKEESGPPSLACLLVHTGSSDKTESKGKSKFAKSASLDVGTSSALTLIGRGKSYLIKPLLVSSKQKEIESEEAGDMIYAVADNTSSTTTTREEALKGLGTLTNKGAPEEFVSDFEAGGQLSGDKGSDETTAGRMQTTTDGENRRA